MIINLTQHQASPEQIVLGVVDLPTEQRETLSQLLTFDDCPVTEEIKERAEAIAELACYNGLSGDEGDSPFIDTAMIGGALWLMAPLAQALKERGIEPFFAFSVRETEEQTQADGSVRKVVVFRHTGWVPAL